MVVVRVLRVDAKLHVIRAYFGSNDRSLLVVVDI